MFFLSRLKQSPCLSYVGCTTTLTLYLVHYFTLFFWFNFVLWVYQQASEGCVGTHGCSYAVLLPYQVNPLCDTFHVWDDDWASVVLLPFSCLSSCSSCYPSPLQGPGLIAPHSEGSSQVVPHSKGSSQIAPYSKGSSQVVPHTKRSSQIAPHSKGSSQVFLLFLLYRLKTGS